MAVCQFNFQHQLYEHTVKFVSEHLYLRYQENEHSEESQSDLGVEKLEAVMKIFFNSLLALRRAQEGK
jgi:hypothetical protein